MNSRAYMPKSKSLEWETPQYLFDELNREFNFTLDPCATVENAKCKKFYTVEDNGLSKSWKGESVFLNPPYGAPLKLWVRKAFYSARFCKVIVALLPVRTGNKWFHSYIYNKAEIRFLKGRLKFSNKQSAPFDNMIVIWRKAL
jgi:site-specific DNA-methyltransferase (adenine-specific)